MAVGYRDVSYSTGTDSTGEGTIPTNAQNGDLMVAFISNAGSGTTISGEPSGWALQEADPNPADFSIWCYTRVKQSGDSNPTWTFSTTGGWTVDIIALSGVHGTTPVNTDIGEQIAASNSIALGDITPSVNDCMLLGYACVDATGAARTWTESGSMSEQLERTDNNMHRAIATELLSGGSGTGVSRTFTVSASAQDIAGFLLAIAPLTGTTLASNKPGYTKGQSTLASNKPGYTKGQSTLVSNKPAYTKGGTAAASNKPAFTKGRETLASNKPSFTKGSATLVSSKPAFSSGKLGLSSNKPAYTKGKSTLTSNKPAYTKGAIVIASNKPAFTKGSAVSSSSKAAYTAGKVVITSNKPAYTEGFATAAISNKPAFTLGIKNLLSPDGDVSTTGTWTNQGGSSNNIYQSIDESPNANDTDYIHNTNALDGDYYECSLQNPTGVPGTGAIVIIVRMKDTAGSGSVEGTIQLRQGTSTVIASTTYTLTSTFASYYLQPTPSERANITDWSDLRIRIIVGIA